ncbi:uncharacterized protein Rexo5 isoform X6 [Macrobrachium rosenbergii]|uniref:uncharacterized protein Rexo5 isoform X6 n=1 Tax=Macrobrachium rosenbergii TaxID=79674 RepID=UPI0034D3F708
MENSGTTVSSRKAKRIENKKRKLIAYLELVQSNNQEHARVPKKSVKDSVTTTEVVKERKEKKDLSLTTKGIKKKKGKKNPSLTTKGIKKKKEKKDPSLTTKGIKMKMEKKDLSLTTKGIKKKKKVKKKKLKKSIAMLVNGVSEKKEQEVHSNSPQLDSSIIDCSYAQLKQMKKQIDVMKRPWPVLELTKAGLDCQIISGSQVRNPVTMKEVQSSLLHFLMPGSFPLPSKFVRLMWRRAVSHTVVAVIEGFSVGILKKFFRCKKTNKKKVFSADEAVNGFSDMSFSEISGRKDTLPKWLLQALPRTCSSLSPIAFEISSSRTSVPLEDLLCVTNINNITWNPLEKSGSGNCTSDQMEENKSSEKADHESFVATVSDSTSINNETDSENGDLPPSDSFDRRQLLLTHSDLYLFKYPVPIIRSYLENGFVYSKDKYQKVKPSSPMYGIDCEMCLSVENRLELASISVVNEDLKLIYHKLVKPEKKIINYLTQFSGLTKEMLENVTTTIQDVQNDLRALLPPDAIFVGHSLNSDLKAMKIMHPYVIDTALAYNLSFNKRRPSSLQILTKLFLERKIQMNPEGHDPTEDAIATLELVQLKLKKGYAFGNVIEGYRLQNGLNIHPQASLNGSPENYSNIFQHAIASRLKTALLMTTASAIDCQPLLERVPKDRVEVHILKENKVLSQKAANIAMSKDFTFLYMKTKNINAESKAMHKENLKKLDKRLQRVFNGACQRSLIMYIFTGSSENEACDESSNGLFMCSIKSIKDNPLSVT